MEYPSHLLIFLTLLLSLFTISISAAPTTFAEVEKSWQRGLSEKDIHAEIGQHPTPSYHSRLPKEAGDGVKEQGFQGMLDERTMAVRQRSLHGVIGGKSLLERLLGQKRPKAEEQGSDIVEVLRPVRNRRWQF
ncbi:unnamed protein product [Aureobasidium uvarum]|uniref:Uncharacterized protein n=1 Tax=Aureobasidium uvarum TaxID=2773716 RepID=A0A9N8PRA0_9PEZI|nr:unnamed protein product [Aureobasidium uvarum]